MSISREFQGSQRRERVVARIEPQRHAVGLNDDMEVHVIGSIHAFERSEWDALFDDALENWHYLRALERAARWEPLYFVIRSGGRAIAAVPAYVAPRVLHASWRDRCSENGATTTPLELVLVLGTPFTFACRIGCARQAAAQCHELTRLLIRTAHAHALGRCLGGVIAESFDERAGDSVAFVAEGICLENAASPVARLALPTWSFADYLIGLEAPLRMRLWEACELAGDFELSWHLDLRHDLAAMLDLCADVGLTALDGEYFSSLLESSTVRMSCLSVWIGTQLAGFNLALHDTRRLRESLVVVRPSAERELVSSLMWLETLRFCLDSGLRVYESSSDEAIAAARPNEVLQRVIWRSLTLAR